VHAAGVAVPARKDGIVIRRILPIGVWQASQQAREGTKLGYCRAQFPHGGCVCRIGRYEAETLCDGGKCEIEIANPPQMGIMRSKLMRHVQGVVRKPRSKFQNVITRNQLMYVG
jgi:hypothetical protein